MAGFTPGANGSVQRARTLDAAERFLNEVRHEVERAAAARSSTPPRLRSIHERPGHATPEYRNLAIPVPDGLGGASPDILAATIARYAKLKRPDRLLLAIDAATTTTDGATHPVLIIEARDRTGTRLFWMQGYCVDDAGAAVWDDPLEGGWRDPGAEEMILDAAFAVAGAMMPPVAADEGRTRRAPPAAGNGAAARRPAS